MTVLVCWIAATNFVPTLVLPLSAGIAKSISSKPFARRLLWCRFLSNFASSEEHGLFSIYYFKHCSSMTGFRRGE